MTGTGRPLGSASDDHDGGGVAEPHPALVGQLRGGDDQPVDSAIDHQVEVVHRAMLVVRRAAQDDRVVQAASRRVRRLDELREERVLDVGDDQAERPRAPHAQRAGYSRRAVAQLVDGLHDGRGRLGLGVADPGEDAAHGRGGYAGALGNVADGGRRRALHDHHGRAGRRPRRACRLVPTAARRGARTCRRTIRSPMPASAASLGQAPSVRLRRTARNRFLTLAERTLVVKVRCRQQGPRSWRRDGNRLRAALGSVMMRWTAGPWGPALQARGASS